MRHSLRHLQGHKLARLGCSLLQPFPKAQGPQPPKHPPPANLLSKTSFAKLLKMDKMTTENVQEILNSARISLTERVLVDAIQTAEKQPQPKKMEEAKKSINGQIKAWP